MPRSLHRVRLVTLACLALARACAAEAPAALPADAPWKAHQTTRAQYPARLIQNGVTHGEARVRVSIDETGRLLDALLLASSRREFGEEAMRVIKEWRFEAARENGAPFGGVGDVTFSFVVNGIVAVVNNSSLKTEDDPAARDPAAYGVESMKRIDRIPTPTHIVPPVYPKEWSDRGLTGSVVVEFYIDESGRARIPFVISGDPLLGGSAVAAVTQWRFEPPTRAGKPVLARAQQVFTFEPPKK